MNTLETLVGTELPPEDLLRELKFFLHAFSPPVVGAHHLTCSDETEHETAATFRRAFARELLPRLKAGAHAPLRTANLGGRYETGAVRIAESHFAAPESRDAFKALVVKVDSHAGVGADGAYGMLERYGLRTTCCGALSALVEGVRLPFAEELAQTFGERLARLRALAPRTRPLCAALSNAALQAGRVVADVREHAPETPTLYVVVYSVTLNRPGPDTTLFGGVHVVDRRGPGIETKSFGLGDDPAAYRIEDGDRRIRVFG